MCVSGEVRHCWRPSPNPTPASRLTADGHAGDFGVVRPALAAFGVFRFESRLAAVLQRTEVSDFTTVWRSRPREIFVAEKVAKNDAALQKHTKSPRRRISGALKRVFILQKTSPGESSDSFLRDGVRDRQKGKVRIIY